MESKAWRCMKDSQSKWSKLLYGKNKGDQSKWKRRKRKNLWSEDKDIYEDFVLLVKT